MFSPCVRIMSDIFFPLTLSEVWELTQGEPRQDMQLPVGEVYPTRDGKFLAILKGSFFKPFCGVSIGATGSLQVLLLLVFLVVVVVVVVAAVVVVLIVVLAAVVIFQSFFLQIFFLSLINKILRNQL